MIETKDFTINLPEDVGRFFFWLVFECRVNFHPDDDFADYVCEATGEATFTKEQAEKYNGVMERCFEVCEKYGRDIYEIAIRTFGLFHYCDCNDALADIG